MHSIHKITASGLAWHRWQCWPRGRASFRPHSFRLLARGNLAGQVNNIAFNLMFLFNNPMCCSRFTCITSPSGMSTWKAASIPWTTSGRVALGDSVSILKEACLWWLANRIKAGEKKLLSLPESKRQLTCIVSTYFTRVILLVSKVLLPKAPLLMESRAQAVISPFSSASILTAAPTNVAGMCPAVCVPGDRHNLVLHLHCAQK